MLNNIIYKPSITTYSSVSDCKMILDELKEELANQFDDATYLKLVHMLDAKKVEITERYNR